MSDGGEPQDTVRGTVSVGPDDEVAAEGTRATRPLVTPVPAKDVGNPLAAGERLRQLKIHAAEARAVDLSTVSKPSELTARLHVWADALRAVQAELDAVVAHKVPAATVAALVATGESYLDFAAAIRSIPMPPQLHEDPDAMAVYRSSLEETAVPMQQRAALLFREALGKAKTDGVEDASTARARSLLSQIAP